MANFKKTVLSLCVLTAALSLTATGLCTQKTSVSAEEIPVERLLSPSSYEEYLSLNAPADTAVTDSYIAVADGNILSVFNRDSGIWQQFAHTGSITKLDFGRKDELFFLDGQTNRLHTLDAKTLTQTPTDIVCSTFSVHGEVVYYINVSAGQTTIYCAPLDDLTDKTELYTGRMYSPALAFWNGELYYVYGTDYLHKLNLATKKTSKVIELPVGVLSMSISNGIVCCVTEEGGFYAYELPENEETEPSPIAQLQDGYSAVSLNGNDAYLIRGSSIRKFSLSENALTDYEIGVVSDSAHRFNGASETLLAGQNLFIADDNNNRISVYDTKAQAFKQAIPTEMDSPFMASYGESLLVATSSQAILYSLKTDNYGAELTKITSDKLSGVIGVTAVYDAYYLLSNEHCYTLTEGATGYEWKESLRPASAQGFTSDANGYLYTLNADTVYRYTEENFCAPTDEGVKICENLPADTTKISVDYAGNLYALANNTLHKYAVSDGLYEKQSELTFDTPFVYGATPTVLSFTFGIEENEGYILYEGNYITVTTAFDLPTVKNIPAETVANGIFDDAEGSFSIVQTLPNSLVIEIDLAKLDGASQFPYLCYYRSQAPVTGVKIGETADYAVISYRADKASEYKTLLIAKERQQTLADGITPCNEKGYLTNGAKAYKFPSMGLPALGEFTKGEEVLLLGKVNGLDCEYYAVAFNGKKVFVPQSHITLFNGAPPASQTVTVGETGADTDSILRVAYLLLGAGAICILVDFLILRKKNKED